MCGRYCLTLTWEGLLEFLRLIGPPLDLTPRYNIAPSQQVPVIRAEEDGRRMVQLRWGLIPFWADDPRIGYKMINARAETAHQLPAFRAAFRGRRCLVPASGFFEWDKRGGTRQPWYIRRADGNELYFSSDNLVNTSFDQLQAGVEVKFIEEAAAEGPQAKRVSIGHHHIAL